MQSGVSEGAGADFSQNTETCPGWTHPGQVRITNWPKRTHVFGMWEEAGVPETTHTDMRPQKGPSLDSNKQPKSFRLLGVVSNKLLGILFLP